VPGDMYVRSVCFSPDGKYLATGAAGDKQIKAGLPISRQMVIFKPVFLFL